MALWRCCHRGRFTCELSISGKTSDVAGNRHCEPWLRCDQRRVARFRLRMRWFWAITLVCVAVGLRLTQAVVRQGPAGLAEATSRACPSGSAKHPCSRPTLGVRGRADDGRARPVLHSANNASTSPGSRPLCASSMPGAPWRPSAVQSPKTIPPAWKKATSLSGCWAPRHRGLVEGAGPSEILLPRVTMLIRCFHRSEQAAPRERTLLNRVGPSGEKDRSRGRSGGCQACGDP